MTIKLTAFDVDGTLLNNKRQVNVTDYCTLAELGENGIIRVAATGRNLFSLHQVFAHDFPIDYAVFSSGAGIIDWKTKKILETHHLNTMEFNEIRQYLDSLGIDFLVKEPIPRSHFMHYNIKETNDLMNYVKHYSKFALPYNNVLNLEGATQFIALINNDRLLYKRMKKHLKTYKTILTTSPIDNDSLWVEIFSNKVSKAKGIDYINKQYNIVKDEVFCIGNDFNDLDMLENFPNSYVVANSPLELRKIYTTVASNNNNGFTAAIHQCLNRNK